MSKDVEPLEGESILRKMREIKKQIDTLINTIFIMVRRLPPEVEYFLLFDLESLSDAHEYLNDVLDSIIKEIESYTVE